MLRDGRGPQCGTVVDAVGFSFEGLSDRWMGFNFGDNDVPNFRLDTLKEVSGHPLKLSLTALHGYAQCVLLGVFYVYQFHD